MQVPRIEIKKWIQKIKLNFTYLLHGAESSLSS